MQILRTMIVIEELAGAGKKLGEPRPDPCGPSRNDTQADLLFGDQPGGLDRRQGGKQLLLTLDLMPTEQVDTTVTGDQRAAKACGFVPLARPSNSRLSQNARKMVVGSQEFL